MAALVRVRARARARVRARVRLRLGLRLRVRVGVRVGVRVHLLVRLGALGALHREGGVARREPREELEVHSRACSGLGLG
jgi:hypothetical protein